MRLDGQISSDPTPDRHGTGCMAHWRTVTTPLKLAQYPAGFAPGITDARVDAPMSPSMRAVTAKALARLRNPASRKELEPYLDDAEAFIEAGMAQIARRSGQECGPIEASMILQGSINHAYSLFFWSMASEDPSNAKLVLMASKLGDAAKAMLSKALEMAVSIARGAPRAPHDPLAALTVESGE